MKMLVTEAAPRAKVMAEEITRMIDIETGYSLEAVHKSNLIAELRGILGYGGMIHQFKNFVLRRDKPRIAKVRALLAEARTTIEEYRYFTQQTRIG